MKSKEVKSGNQRIDFYAHGVPQTKGSTVSFVSKSGKLVTRNDNAKCRSWTNTVRLLAQQNAPEKLWTGPVVLLLFFDRQKPVNYPKTKERWCTKRPDLDKQIRAIKDALTGVVYKDDSQVVFCASCKQYSDISGVKVVAYQIDKSNNTNAVEFKKAVRDIIANTVIMTHSALYTGQSGYIV